MGNAIGYTNSRWSGLSAHAFHGEMEIDNNLEENAVRPIAIGRKTYIGSFGRIQISAAPLVLRSSMTILHFLPASAPKLIQF